MSLTNKTKDSLEVKREQQQLIVVLSDDRQFNGKQIIYRPYLWRACSSCSNTSASRMLICFYLSFHNRKDITGNCLEFTQKPILRLFYIHRTSSIVLLLFFFSIKKFISFSVLTHNKIHFLFLFVVISSSCQSNLDKIRFASPTSPISLRTNRNK